jgi:uracil-DNA glycosylase family 4
MAKRKEALDLSAIAAVCGSCPLNEGALLQHPKMPPSGTTEPLIYIMGEAPGGEEDKEGSQFVGRAGQFLRRFIPPEMLSFIRWNNTIRCRPPSNRDPDPLETHCCRPLQEADIERTKPWAIWGFGNFPLAWACGATNITRWRGKRFPVRIGSHVCWYYPMLHPSYLMRQSGGNRDMANDTIRVFDRDIQKALYDLQTTGETDPADGHYETPDAYGEGVRLILDQGMAFEMATDDVRTWKTVTVDIETNSRIRPYNKGAKILCISFSNGETTYAMPWALALRFIRDLFDGRTFVAHNAKYEMEWLYFFLGRVVFNARWEDTMGQSYILDERWGVINGSLGNLTTTLFGFDVKAQSTIDMKNLEREYEQDPEKVLRYNALDAKYTARAHPILAAELEAEQQTQIFNDLMDALPALILAQAQGLPVDFEELMKQHAHQLEKINKIERRLFSREDVQAFMRERQLMLLGKRLKPGETPPPMLEASYDDYFNIGSWQQIKAFFLTQGIALESTDEEHMSKEKHPVAKLILEWRGVNKLVSTYLNPLMSQDGNPPEQLHDDGLIHTNLNPYITNTGRLSSNEPNIQNYPNRQHKEVRKIIVPPPGFTLLSADYGQIEARIIAQASQDKYFIKALMEGMDIHMVWTDKLLQAYPPLYKRFEKLVIAMCKEGEKPIPTGDAMLKAVRKALRTEIKNMWVFPAFYGATVGAVAMYLGIPEHIIEPLFDEFWFTFASVKKWQNNELRLFKERGYVETLTGRRRHGPMKSNEIINSSIQGTAHDITLRSMSRMGAMSLALDIPWLAPIMEIHDDLTFFVPTGQVSETAPLIAEVMCTPRFSWLTVPITVEVSTGPNWCDKKELAVYDSRQFAQG